MPIEPWRSAQTRFETGALWGRSDSTNSGPLVDVEDAEAGLGDARVVERRPAQRERLVRVGVERLVDDRPVVGAADLEQLRLVAPADRDLLVLDLQRPTLAAKLVRVAVDPLDEEVHHVGHRVGQRPGDVVVLAEDDPDPAGEGGAAAAPAVDLDPKLVGDAGHRGREVRVAGQQRAAGRRALGRHRPVVRAGRLRGEPERRSQLVELADQAGAVAAPGPARRERHRVAGRITGLEARGALGTELAGHVGAQQLALPVGRERRTRAAWSSPASRRGATARSRCARA